MGDRLAQLLGVVALAATDRFRSAVEESLGRGGAYAAALVHLDAYPGEAVGALGEVLGVSQPAAVKIADRLAGEGLLDRRPGPDRRTTALHLTAAGRQAAARVLADRTSELGTLLGVLDATERRDLERLLERLVSGLAEDRRGALHACRLCDRAACYGSGPDCPLEHTMP
jgi:MarR family transcriptional regulator, negative regulator of the multidrug operon emrRAB